MVTAETPIKLARQHQTEMVPESGMSAGLLPSLCCSMDILSALPEALKATLLPFQRDGVAFAVRHGGRCLIADEMGLGNIRWDIMEAFFQVYRIVCPDLLPL